MKENRPSFARMAVGVPGICPTCRQQAMLEWLMMGVGQAKSICSRCAVKRSTPAQRTMLQEMDLKARKAKRRGEI